MIHNSAIKLPEKTIYSYDIPVTELGCTSRPSVGGGSFSKFPRNYKILILEKYIVPQSNIQEKLSILTTFQHLNWFALQDRPQGSRSLKFPKNQEKVVFGNGT